MQSKIVFREMLSELKALADVQGNYLTKEDIKKFFPGDAASQISEKARKTAVNTVCSCACDKPCGAFVYRQTVVQ